MTEFGSVEAKTRALVDSLGELSARQAVTAEQAIALAGRLDGELDGSKASALSRELRMLVGLMLPTSVGEAGGRAKDSEGKPDPVAGVVRSIEAKRQQRKGASA